MKHRLLQWLTVGMLVLGLAQPVAAQITPTYTFSPNTVIQSAQVNANFNLLLNAVNRNGGTMLATLNTRALIPTLTATYDLGTSGLQFRDFYLSRNATIGGTLSVTGAATFGAVTITGITCTGCVTSTNVLDGTLLNADINASAGIVITKLATFTSAELATQLTNESGTGVVAFTISPTFTTPTLGAATATSVSTNNAGWEQFDTNASHHLIMQAGSDLTADRTLVLITGDSGRTLTLSGNPTLADWFDQSVKSTASPTFVMVTSNLTGNVTGNVSGTAATVTTAAQPAITSLGTLTTLTVDDITINGNTISSAGATTLTITPAAGQAIVFDGTVTLDAGVIAGATSITSTVFVGELAGRADTALALFTPRAINGVNFDGTAAITVTVPVSTGVTGLGTGVATALAVNIGSAGAPVLFDGAGGTPSSMTGTNITGIPETAITDGSIFARLAANESVTGQYTFTASRAGDYQTYVVNSSATGNGLYVRGGDTTQRSLSVNNYSDTSEIFYVTPAATVVNAGNFVINATSAQSNLTSTGVNQPMTAIAASNVFWSQRVYSSGIGGMTAYGLTDSDGVPVSLYGVHGNASPTMASITIAGGKTNGATSWQALASTEIVAQFTNFGTNLIRVMGDGDLAMLAASRVYLDGIAATGDTYLVESTANTIALVAGGVSTNNVSGVWTFPVSGSTFTTDLKVLGAEAGNATLYLWADEGDDSGDKWRIYASAGGSQVGFAVDGSEVFQIIANEGIDTLSRYVNVVGDALGATTVGPQVQIGSNSSGSGAAGSISWGMASSSSRFTWVDSAGDFRISTAAPAADGSPSDTSGTVVGTQTSMRSTKNIYGTYTDNAASLSLMLNTPLYDFDYKSGAMNHQRFIGITTDDSPAFGMDLGRSFNPVSAFGHTVAAIKELERRIAALEVELAKERKK